MANEREEIGTQLKSLPDDTADEDVQYRRYVLEKIHGGLESAEMQPTFTQEEAEARLRTGVASDRAEGASPLSS